MTKHRYWLGTTVLAGALAVSVPAWAQEQDEAARQSSSSSATQTDQAVMVEEVVVTGSRIPRPQYEGTIPGVQVTSKDITERLFTNAGDVLNDIPLVGAGASLNGTNGGQTASLGVTYVDLLNLGTARTLTLVNGRRFVSNNSATIFVSGNETGSQVDASTIPVALIDRVDVLTVGGAAAYGADAVSGVVNYVLKDRYEGAEVNLIGGQTFDYQDAARYSVNATYGRNFLDDRLNVAVSGEYSHIDSVLGDQRDFLMEQAGSISNPFNGGMRNGAFSPGAVGSTAFLPSGADGQPNLIYTAGLRSYLTWYGGQIFNPTFSGLNEEYPAVAGLVPGGSANMPGFARIAAPAWSFFSSALQQIPGAPNLCNAGAFSSAAAAAAASANPRICNFAPSSLPGATAAEQDAIANRVFSFYNVARPTGATAAQVRAAALQVLQANNPTAREYFAANPNVPLNAFLGSFIAGLPDVANTGAFAGMLPRTAVPIRFDASGNVAAFSYGSPTPTTPGTAGSSVGGDGALRQFTNVLRVEQERYVANVIGSYRVTDNIQFFTENLYSDITVRNPFSSGGLFNGVTSSSTENAALLVNVNHPFLTAQNRADLAAAGITGNFTLSRYNEDLVNDISQESTMETIRSVNGFKGDFEAFGRSFGWELSHTYGKAETQVEFSAIRDVEFAMALDAVNVNGEVVCRAKAVGLNAYLNSFGASRQIPGIQPQIISQIGSDGVREQVIFQNNVTQQMVDNCAPVNVFGEGRASQAAKDFVSVRNFFKNESTQNFTQATLTGELFNLPAGPLQFAISGELRKEELAYTTDEVNRIGGTRSAPSATTFAEVETREGGIELRIPVFGGDFQVPYVGSLEINPSVRWTRLKGEAASFRDTSGTLRTPTYKGETENVYTIAATWQPIDDIAFRGNVSRSVRNPSIVELFLGGQPFFTSIPQDPCSVTNIDLRSNRRANCVSDVLAKAAANGGRLGSSTGGGLIAIASEADATSFLASHYRPNGSAFTGLISGAQTLKPEQGESWTAGVVLQPRFLPGLMIASDYLEIEVTDALGPLLAQPAAEFCYDSPNFPDNTADVGVNSCAGIRRDSNFQYTNGFELPFFNLGSTKVRAVNANVAYSHDIEGTPWPTTIGFRGNAYYLLEYTQSASGTYEDATSTRNTLANPQLKLQLTALLNTGRLNARWTIDYQDSASIKSSGIPIGIEFQPIVSYPSYSLHRLSVGWDFTDSVRGQFVVDNVFDKNSLGAQGYYNDAYVDRIGRRWTMSLGMKF